MKTQSLTKSDTSLRGLFRDSTTPVLPLSHWQLHVPTHSRSARPRFGQSRGSAGGAGASTWAALSFGFPVSAGGSGAFIQRLPLTNGQRASPWSNTHLYRSHSVVTHKCCVLGAGVVTQCTKLQGSGGNNKVADISLLALACVTCHTICIKASPG